MVKQIGKHTNLASFDSIGDSNKIWTMNAERWHTLGPPWRPSAGDIENYRRLAKEKLSGYVLILGATPELRDSVAQARLPGTPCPVVADSSIMMLERMSKLLRFAEPCNEKWIISDWCNLALTQNYFDLVLGDVIWQLLSPIQQIKLRKIIADILKPNGLFVSRFRFRALQRLTDRPEYVIRYYLRELDRLPANAAVLRDSMVVHLGDIFVDTKTKQINRRLVVNAITSAMRHHTTLSHQKFLRQAELMVGSIANITSQTREEVLAGFKKKFFQLNEATATDYLVADDAVLSFGKHT